MKLPNPEHFNFKDCVIRDNECFLIYPKYSDVGWAPDNLHFRSVIVRKSDNTVISRGFPKFFNINQSPDVNIFPDGPFQTYTKHDGSLLILSYYKDEVIARTRNSISVESMANGSEIEYLKAKYKKLWNTVLPNNQEYSILCEWQTKSNVIVIDEVDEPTLTLIGAIHNQSGKLVAQNELDLIASAWGLTRPKKHSYNSLSECLEDVKMWEGQEGVVCYSEDGQHLLKIKSDWYLLRHKLCTGIKNINHVVDLFMDSERFTRFDDFYNFVNSTMGYEVAEKIKEDMLKIVEAYNKTLEQYDKVKKVVDKVRGDSYSRKDQAQEITSHYNDWRTSAGFSHLDNKPLDDKILRKGLEANL